jgi:hypothetical protein
MRNIYLFLALTTAMILIFHFKSDAQQKIVTSISNPVTVVTKNGTYKICVEGSLNDYKVKNNSTTLSKSKSLMKEKSTDINEGVKSGLHRRMYGGTVDLGKNIKYGPWRMLNNFDLPKITIDDYFEYGSNGDKEPRGGGSGKATRQMITSVIPDRVSILKLSHSDQLTVLLGQQYSVQVGKFTFDKGVNPAMQKIATITTLPVIVIIKNGFYHILIEGFAGLRDANMFIVKLAKIGYKGTIVKLNNPVRVENITHR